MAPSYSPSEHPCLSRLLASERTLHTRIRTAPLPVPPQQPNVNFIVNLPRAEDLEMLTIGQLFGSPIPIRGINAPIDPTVLMNYIFLLPQNAKNFLLSFELPSQVMIMEALYRSQFGVPSFQEPIVPFDVTIVQPNFNAFSDLGSCSPTSVTSTLTPTPPPAPLNALIDGFENRLVDQLPAPKTEPVGQPIPRIRRYTNRRPRTCREGQAAKPKRRNTKESTVLSDKTNQNNFLATYYPHLFETGLSDEKTRENQQAVLSFNEDLENLRKAHLAHIRLLEQQQTKQLRIIDPATNEGRQPTADELYNDEQNALNNRRTFVWSLFIPGR